MSPRQGRQAARRRDAVRIRVGGVVLALAAGPGGPALRIPATHRAFRSRRGGDIRLTVVRAPVPEGRPDRLLFDSAGPWRVFGHEGGLLYVLSSEACRPQTYRGALVDGELRGGTLFVPRGEAVPRLTLQHPLDELLLTHRLAGEGHAVLHACGIRVRGRVALLCGESGAGKSTSARLWTRLRPASVVLSDDRVVVRRTSRGLRAFGTPWHGEAGFAVPASAPLAAVFFIRHAAESRALPLAVADAASRLFARSFPPLWDGRGVARVLDCCGEIAARVPCFDLPFRPDISAIEAVLGAL